MIENIWFIVAFWMGLALLASLISIRQGWNVVVPSDHPELWGGLLGDTADRGSDHAYCSVLVVKQDPQAPES
jgi:nucleotide-binding universal stress UspA family protein